MKKELKNELLDIVENSVIRHIQNLLKNCDRPVTYEEAKTLLRHLAVKLITEDNEKEN